MTPTTTTPETISEAKLLPIQPRCSCGGQCYPLADRRTEFGDIIVRRQCRVCGNVMWQRQKIEPTSEINETRTVQKIASERVDKKRVTKKLG